MAHVGVEGQADGATPDSASSTAPIGSRLAGTRRSCARPCRGWPASAAIASPISGGDAVGREEPGHVRFDFQSPGRDTPSTSPSSGRSALRRGQGRAVSGHQAARATGIVRRTDWPARDRPACPACPTRAARPTPPDDVPASARAAPQCARTPASATPPSRQSRPARSTRRSVWLPPGPPVAAGPPARRGRSHAGADHTKRSATVDVTSRTGPWRGAESSQVARKPTPSRIIRSAARFHEAALGRSPRASALARS